MIDKGIHFVKSILHKGHVLNNKIKKFFYIKF